MRHFLRPFVLPAFSICLLAIPAIGRPQEQPSLPKHIRPLLDACNVNWDIPGPTSAESMPLGNGDIGLNVWVEPNGDLLFYIGKTDSWSADVRGPEGLMKVGGIRVSFDPQPLVNGAPFQQSLRLHDGEILIREGNDLQLRVWVDANHPVIRVEAQSSRPVAEKVALYDWRLGKGGDTLLPNGTNNVTWYHRDSDHADRHVAGLIFGGMIKGKGFVRAGDTLLQAAAATYRLISIYPLTAQTTIPKWRDHLDRQVADIDRLGLDATRQAHHSWWDRFWQRSWIFVPQADSVTRGYILQRFITACAGRGAYPIKFNGSVFVVDNPALKQENSGSKPMMPVSADFRTWGGQYWFQNTRPMYWPLLMEGDFDEMMPLFRMYTRIIHDNAVQIDTFYHHTGSYFAETAPFWGGLRYWGPEVKEDWTGHYFTPVLELSMMMLDYYAYTGDRAFVKDYLVPVAAAGLAFFDKHFGRDDEGKLLLDPDNSIEMFWKVHDPAPDIAGLGAIIPRLLALPPDLTTEQQRTAWKKLWQELPELPKGTRNGLDVLLPYTGIQNARPRNLENPELYAVYPFRLYGLGKPDLTLAVNTFNTRKFRDKGCWVQDPIQAAMLGMPDIARTYVSYNLTRRDPRLKFPAFWAQGHDYVPDEDNGGNGENGLQQMLMQTAGKKILLLPAWPAGWDAEFRLHAPCRTTVTGRVVGGKLMDLVVIPAARRADVIDMSANHGAAAADIQTASETDAPTAADTSRLTTFVDPYIGSGGHGHVFLGASVPFGAVQPGPENFYKGWDWCSGYHYGDSILIGFAHTHLSGTGIGDLGDVLIMPYTGPVKTDKGKETIPGSGYASHYSHAHEVVRPGYYAVRLDNYDIRVELTATERVGFHRYHFPEGQPGHVIIDLKEGINDHATDTYIEQLNDSTFLGRRYSSGWAKDQWLYFAIRTSSPIHRFDIYEGDSLLAGKSGKGIAIKGLITWDQAPALFQLKVGLSPVSPENALANIDAEVPGWDFDAVARDASDKWEQELSRIRIETKSKTDKRIFYTALYHTMIDPMLFNDHNGDYRGADKQVYTHASFQNYTVFSLWDTYRALNPLYTLIQPDRVDDIIHSLLAIDQQQGKLPVWHLEGCETNTMPGLSSVQVVAEAYLKGFRGFDAQQAFDAMNSSMMKKDRGLDYDQQEQYIPSDKAHESVAMGLEYAVSNASIALVAKQLGKKSEAGYYDRRFHNYTQYYDSVTGFFRGKKADGTWNEPFDPARSSRPWINDLSEGNHWQYLWLVPEDVEGLIHLVGGERRFIKRLDSLFTIPVLPDPHAPPDIAGLIGQYAHGDEPGHQTIYLYAYAGQQWKSAEKARFIMKNMYPDNVDGLSGNEDCGQMSAWYIFSALGFYPVFPANGGYVLGSPLFDKATIALPGGKSFRIIAINNSAENKYIQRAEWNGKAYDKSYILHRGILAGGTLTLYMGRTPNRRFGSSTGNRPRSVYSDAAVPAASSDATAPAAQERHHFDRDFAPTDAYTSPQERPFRDDTCLNGNWQFMPVTTTGLTPAQLREPQLPQQPSWEGVPVKVPSPWNVNSFAGGDHGGDFVTYPSYPKQWESVRAGWLMRTLPYRKEWQGKRLILHFTAVAGYAQIYINKQKVGENSDVFLPFDIDVTNYIRPNANNELMVWVADANLFNEPGKFGRRTYVGGSFWGQHIIGIWQDVYLAVKPMTYVANMAVRPFVSRDVLEVVAAIRNESAEPKHIRVTATIAPWINLAGHSVPEAPEPRWRLGAAALTINGPEVIVPAHAEKTVTLSTTVRGRLRLWSSDSPNLNGLVVSLSGAMAHDQPGTHVRPRASNQALDPGHTFDRAYTRFGWREARIDNGRFTLNGRPMILKGDSWHFMGIPQMTRRYAWGWYTMLRDAHANAVRLHAEPYPALYLDVADEMGMMILDETGMWASDGGPKENSEAYWTSAEDHLQRFILRDRNHPSVFGWSVCNENLPVVISVQHAPDSLVRRQVSEINRWVATARALDPSREWISGDGETQAKTDLPTVIGHYGDEHAFREWAGDGKLWGIGESGMAYYGTPRQSSVYNGDESYVSQFGRMQGVADEAVHILNLQKKYKASYEAIFNLIWYSLKPLELGLDDTTRAPQPSDGIFFPPFREGRGGVQPERLGSYTSTLNPGYDPALPLYRTWPLFDAIRLSFSDSGMVTERPAPPPHSALAPTTGHWPVFLLSADRDSALAGVLREMGVALHPVTFAGPPAKGLLILDGRYPPADDASLQLTRSLLQSGGTLLVWGARQQAQDQLNRYLPKPVTLTERKATSYIVSNFAAGDALIDGLGNADFYFSELSREPVSECGLTGDFVRDGQVLLTDCNTDWNSWNNQPEYRKTISVLRSEREAKPEGNALVAYQAGQGRIYCLTFDPSRLYHTSELLTGQLLRNLGAAFTDTGTAHQPAFDAYGVLHNYDTIAAQAGMVGISWWLYSPRSLTDLLAEPDLPRLDLQVQTPGDFGIVLNDKTVNRQVLPLERGWNHLVVTVSRADLPKTMIKLNSNRKEFLQEIRSRIKQ